MKNVIHLMAVSMAAAVVLLSSCMPIADGGGSGPAPTSTQEPTLIMVFSNAERSTEAAPPEDLSALVAGQTEFALNLYRQLAGQEGNLFLSPYSISTALSMAYGGARGETASQMADVLQFDLPDERLFTAINDLDRQLTAPTRGRAGDDDVPMQLNIVNALWSQRGETFQQAYLDLLAVYFDSAVHLVDFIQQPEEARREINDYVAGNTNGKITDLVPPGVITPDTRLMLVNAIYFSAGWEQRFHLNLTTPMPFYRTDGSQVEVEMMGLIRPVGFRYASGEGWQAVVLPYQTGSTEMLVLLPDEGRFAEVEAALDAELLQEVSGSLEELQVELRMPKFTFSSQFQLGDVLPAMGMAAAFDPDRADFSGMTGMSDLVIGDVIHKTYVAVDESGTEAAGATAVEMVPTSLPVVDVTLTIDRPFIFVIRDVRSGSILFLGRVVDPAAGQ